MSKIRNFLTIISFFLAIGLFFTTVVFGWMIFIKEKPLATFEAGKIVLTTTVNGSPITSNIYFNNLAYVDFSEDVYEDSSGELNRIASVTSVRLIDGMGSIEIRNQIEIQETSERVGLLLLIIYEGKSVPFYQIGVEMDYHSLILSIIGEETNEVNQRQLITNYNLNSILMMNSTPLSAGEWISFQIVAWGDYNSLASPSLFLSDYRHLQISIFTEQWEGGIV